MFEKSKELEALSKTVIVENADLKHLDNPSLRIVYMYCDKEKKSGGKTVYADITKVSDKMKAIAPYDFLITFYKPSCDMLDDEKMKTLMRHGLKHIGIQDGKFRIVPHDVEDF